MKTDYQDNFAEMKSTVDEEEISEKCLSQKYKEKIQRREHKLDS
jgi:hypothetical protein